MSKLKRKFDQMLARLKLKQFDSVFYKDIHTIAQAVKSNRIHLNQLEQKIAEKDTGERSEHLLAKVPPMWRPFGRATLSKAMKETAERTKVGFVDLPLVRPLSRDDFIGIPRITTRNGNAIHPYQLVESPTGRLLVKYPYHHMMESPVWNHCLDYEMNEAINGLPNEAWPCSVCGVTEYNANCPMCV